VENAFLTPPETMKVLDLPDDLADSRSSLRESEAETARPVGYVDSGMPVVVEIDRENNQIKGMMPEQLTGVAIDY
jgi:hypothetical protein